MRTHHIFNSLIGFILIAILSTEVSAETTYRIQSADNLNSIVDAYYPERRKLKSQIMVGILIENPRAFKGGNINFLLRGKRLRLLDENDLSEVTIENAQQLLNQHAFYFRKGVTGSEKLLSPNLGGKVEVNFVNESIDIPASQNDQILKINKLQNEGDELKKRLERLLEEKINTDKQLIELESSIKGFSENQGYKTSDISRVVTRNKELKETNSFLQQKLHESQSELAENTRSKLTLERQVSTLKEQPNKAEEPLSVTLEKAAEVKVDYNALWDKYNWILILFLVIALFWMLLKWKKKRDFERDDDYASMIAENEESSFFHQGKNSE